MFLNIFKKKEMNKVEKSAQQSSETKNNGTKQQQERIATRKGEFGEYKIDIQLSQLPKEYRHLSDLLIKNPKSATGFSQIDHVIITPYGIFVIETKNYQGTIYGGIDRKTWLINGKFKMMSPIIQNYGHIHAIKNYIDSTFHQYFISIVSFTKRCTFKIDQELRKIQSDELVIYDIELTDFINRKIAVLKLQNKNPLLSIIEIERIYNALSKANILYPDTRKQHVDNIQKKSNEH